jgi:phage terminase Nu1 subunit (DNA packaging protein)
VIVSTIKDVAAIFGVSHETIRTWQAEGMPVLVRGGGNKPSQFDSAAVHAWLVARAVRKAVTETPNDRLARVKAESIEIDISEKLRYLIPAADVEPAWTAACIAAREKLQRAKRPLARSLARCKTDAERERLIGEVHDEFLRQMSTWDDADEADAVPVQQ